MKFKTAFCVNEDRPTCLVGVKLAVLSIQKYHPGIPILLNTPGAPSSFHDWAATLSGVSRLSYAGDAAVGYNVKPRVLMRALDEGYESVIWVDADIIVCSSILESVADQPDDVLVGTEETYFGQYQGGTIRTEAWGLPVGRSLPTTMNTGIVRVTSKHRLLLNAWDQLLHHPLYARLQRSPWYERPLHLISDQEVFTGLLGSTAFSNIPILFLKRGSEIAQCMGPAGFTPAERLRSFFSHSPDLVHSMGVKPWLRGNVPKIGLNLRSLRKFYEFLHAELAPYSAAAMEYRPFLGENSDWMNLSTKTSRVFAAVFGNSAVLKELPLAIFDSIVRHSRHAFGIARYQIPEEYRLKESPLSS